LGGLFGRPVELEGARAVVADENYLRESIVDPRAKKVKGYQPIMPTFQGQISEEGLLQLVAYIKSLSKAQPAKPPAPAAAATGTRVQEP
jgi:cytochrome c oxidase subunit 2